MATTNRLTAVFVKQCRKPGKYRDGLGLTLCVFETGAKRWVLRLTVRGRRREVGLGSAHEVTLQEARDRAADLRKAAREGKDPVAAQRAARISVPTFKEAAEQEFERRSAGWSGGKHPDQWINTLRQHAYPAIGDLLVSDISERDIFRVLSSIWITMPETARRVRQRIRVVLESARAAGHRDGINPADTVRSALGRQPKRSKHHPAIPFAEVPAFVRRLQGANGDALVRLAFEFLILTAARTNEVRGARWDEIDTQTATWTIPSQRMKANEEHRVPLSKRCLEILRLARELASKSELVFPSRRTRGSQLSDGALLMQLRRLGRTETVHGFRSSFRTWAAEETNYAREVCEAALAHQIENAVEASYRRGDLFAKRKELMAAWEQYVAGASAPQRESHHDDERLSSSPVRPS